MHFSLNVPDSVRDELEALGLASWILVGLYEELDTGITQEQFDKMWRFAFGTTRTHHIEIPDLSISGNSHFFTLYLTPGPKDNQLTVHQCDYKLWQDWEHDSTAFDGDGNPV